MTLDWNSATAALLVVTNCLQIAVSQAANDLDSHVLYTLGVHFPAIVITMWGSITGLAAVSYALCVWRSAVLPRWTAYLAVLCLIVGVGSTAAVFIGTGPFR